MSSLNFSDYAQLPPILTREKGNVTEINFFKRLNLFGDKYDTLRNTPSHPADGERLSAVKLSYNSDTQVLSVSRPSAMTFNRTPGKRGANFGVTNIQKESAISKDYPMSKTDFAALSAILADKSKIGANGLVIVTAENLAAARQTNGNNAVLKPGAPN